MDSQCHHLLYSKHILHLLYIFFSFNFNYCRYLYCEEFLLDDDLVYDVMYVAKKYLIFSLTERCLEYLITNLTPQNVCCSLNYALFYDERELLKKSLRVVSVNTREVFASDFFLHVSGRTIGTILACGALNATEEEIFAASLAWAKGECGRLGLDSRTPGALRMALGANLYQLRLAAISEEAIARDVLGSGLLTQQEETHLMEYREDPGAGKPLPFQTRKRSWIEVGCVSCDFVQTTTQATVLAKTCHEHTIKVSEAVNLHQVVVLDRRPSTMVGIQIIVSQYGTCLRRSSMPIPTLRGNTVYGKTIPISFPQTVPVEAGEFSVDIVYQFIGTYGTVTCCVPHNEAVVCNGVRCEISYKASCQIASLGLSVA